MTSKAANMNGQHHSDVQYTGFEQPVGIYDESWDETLDRLNAGEMKEIERLLSLKKIPKEMILKSIENALRRTSRYCFREGEIVTRNFLSKKLADSADVLKVKRKIYE